MHAIVARVGRMVQVCIGIIQQVIVGICDFEKG